jgi:hypothetical protein
MSHDLVSPPNRARRRPHQLAEGVPTDFDLAIAERG